MVSNHLSEYVYNLCISGYLVAYLVLVSRYVQEDKYEKYFCLAWLIFDICSESRILKWKPSRFVEELGTIHFHSFISILIQWKFRFCTDEFVKFELACNREIIFNQNLFESCMSIMEEIWYTTSHLLTHLLLSNTFLLLPVQTHFMCIAYIWINLWWSMLVC